MAFINSINKIKNGDWVGLGADVLSAASMAIPIPGVGALVSAGVQAGASALKGEGTGSIIKAGAGDLVGGSIGKGLGKVASKVGSTVGKTAIGSKVVNGVNSMKAGKAVGAAAGAGADVGVKGKLPSYGDLVPKGANANVITGKVSAQGNSLLNLRGPAPIGKPAVNPTGVSGGKPELRPPATINKTATLAPVPGMGPKPELRPKANTGNKGSAGTWLGQYGLQGALSIASGIAAAKQANAANDVAKQGLLFQKQTYDKQKSEEEKTKARLKEDAYNTYNSSLLFGENMTASSPSNNILTDSVNGVGGGSFSILDSGITGRRSTDLT